LDHKTGRLTPNNTPLIDCNATSGCAFLAASSDLTSVLVDVVPITNDPAGPRQPCELLTYDAERWGFALYKGAGVSATMPQPYDTQWAGTRAEYAAIKDICGSLLLALPRPRASFLLHVFVFWNIS
jgi:hypothetical protein